MSLGVTRLARNSRLKSLLTCNVRQSIEKGLRSFRVLKFLWVGITRRFASVSRF
jgi:hypothetical protein